MKWLLASLFPLMIAMAVPDLPEDGRWRVIYHVSDTQDSNIAHVDMEDGISYTWWTDPPFDNMPGNHYMVEADRWLTVDHGGLHYFRLTVAGAAALYVDGGEPVRLFVSPTAETVYQDVNLNEGDHLVHIVFIKDQEKIGVLNESDGDDPQGIYGK
jgi:hypothetical protein